MVSHFCRRQGLGHQRRIRNHQVNTRLRQQTVHQTVHRVFVLGVIDQHKRIRTRENLFDLRLGFRGKEDRRLTTQIPGSEEEDHRAHRHR